MGYVEREDFDVTLDRIKQLLENSSVDPQLVEDARALIKRHPFELFRCVAGGRPTIETEQVRQSGPRTEPTDFALGLVAALAANDADAFIIIAHEIRSLAGPTTPG